MVAASNLAGVSNAIEASPSDTSLPGLDAVNLLLAGAPLHHPVTMRRPAAVAAWPISYGVASARAGSRQRAKEGGPVNHSRCPDARAMRAGLGIGGQVNS